MSSKKVMANTINSGNNDKETQENTTIEVMLPIDQANPIKILSKICPESMLAKSLTDKLMTRAK
jgi:hypothetical protein